MTARYFLCAFALLLVPQVVLAHAADQSYIYLRVYDGRIEARVEMSTADIDQALGLGLSDDGQITEAEIARHLDALRAFAEPRFAFTIDGERVPLQFVGTGLADNNINDYVHLIYAIEGLAEIPDAIDVRYDLMFDVDRDHVNMLTVEHNWKTATFNNEGNVALVFTPANTEQTLDLSNSTFWNGFWGLVWLGVWHILIGLDHILFLLALILPAVLVVRNGAWEPVESFKPAFINIVKIVTFFTIAHSVTLTLAALGIITLPSKLVETIIAASIAVAALHNLYPRFTVKEWMIAFGFGLFHGFGFASVMADIGMGGERLAVSVLAFNIGVELGQIAIIAVIFPVLYLIRKQRWYVPVVVRLGSVLLILAAVVWVIERLAGMTIGWMFYLLRQRFGF